MSRHELYALRNQASADHGGTTTSAPGTGGHAETSAASNDAGGKANDGKPADSSGTSQAESSAQEGGDASANAAAPVHGTGCTAAAGALDRNGGDTSIPVAVDDDRGGEGQEAISPVPDSGPEDGFRDQPDGRAVVAGDGDHDGAPGGQGNVNSDGHFDRIGDRSDAGASGSQGQDSGENAQRKPQASADDSQPAQRAEGTTEEKSAEGQGGETPGPQSKDRPPAQSQSPDVGTDLGEQGGTSSEAAPDQSPDDPRWATVFSAIESVKAENQEIKTANQEMRQQIGDLKVDLDSSEAEKAHLKSELSDLRTELETFKAEHQQRQPGQPDSGEQPEPSSTPNVIKQGERSEGAKLSKDPRDATNDADTGAVDRRGTHASGMEGHKTEPTGRHIFSAENVGAAAAGIALGQSVVQTFANLPPEVGVGASAVGFVGASMATSFIKRILEKRRD